MNPSAIKQLAIKKVKKVQCFSRRKRGIAFIENKGFCHSAQSRKSFRISGAQHHRHSTYKEQCKMKEESNNFIKCELNSYPDFEEHVILKLNILKAFPYHNFPSTYSLQSQNFGVIVKITHYTKVQLLLKNPFIVIMRKTTHMGANSKLVYLPCIELQGSLFGNFQ